MNLEQKAELRQKVKACGAAKRELAVAKDRVLRSSVGGIEGYEAMRQHEAAALKLARAANEIDWSQIDMLVHGA